MILALIAILSTIAIPVFDGVLEDLKLNTEARHCASVLRQARSDAIFYGTTIGIKFYINDNSYKVMYTQIPDRKDIRYRLAKDITYVGNTTLPQGTDRNPYCGFTPSGTPNGSGTVTLTNNRGTKRYIIINPVAGRVRVASEPPAHWN